MIFWLILLVFSVIGTLVYIFSAIGNALLGQGWGMRALVASGFFIADLTILDALNWVTIF